MRRPTRDRGQAIVEYLLVAVAVAAAIAAVAGTVRAKTTAHVQHQLSLINR